MRIGWVKAQAAVTFAVLGSSVGAALVGAGATTGVTLAGPQVLRLIQNSSAALSTYPALRMTTTIEATGQGRDVTGHESGTLTPDGRNGTASIDISGRHLSLLVVNGVAYARAPRLASTHTWVSFDPGIGASKPGGLGVPSGTDALQYLHMLPGATGPVEVVGRDRVDGVPTTHYRVTIDLAKAYASLPSRLQTAAPGAVAALGLTTMPYDIWLDDAHSIRQLEFRVSAHDVTLDGRIDIRGSNEPVRVTAPPAADVLRVSDIKQFYAIASGQ